MEPLPTSAVSSWCAFTHRPTRLARLCFSLASCPNLKIAQNQENIDLTEDPAEFERLNCLKDNKLLFSLSAQAKHQQLDKVFLRDLKTKGNIYKRRIDKSQLRHEAALAQIISTAPNLSSAKMSLGLDGVLLGPAVGQAKSLRELDLSRNSIMQSGFKLLCKGFSGHPS